MFISAKSRTSTVLGTVDRLSSEDVVYTRWQ